MVERPVPTPGVVISGIGPMCAAARSAADLVSTARPTDSEREDWFNPQDYLGKRGFKYFMPSTRYVLAATRVALEDAGIPEDRYRSEDCGVAIGTNFGMASSHREFDRVILDEGANSLSPMSAPNFSINLAAGQVSIQHGFRAFNMTLTNPIVAGLEAVLVGARSIREGRARMAVVGAAEEAAPDETARFLGVERTAPGACALVLESGAAVGAGGGVYAAVGDGACWLYPANGGNELASLLARQLAAVVAPGSRQLSTCVVAAQHAFGERVRRRLAKAFEEAGVDATRVDCEATDGQLVTVSPILAAAALVMRHQAGLVVATSPFGHVAMLQLKRIDPGLPRKVSPR